jgi:hypothetical protein
MALVKYNNNSLSAITAASGLTAGAMTLIKEQTASSSSTIDFVDGTSDVVLDSTYPIYLFKFINIHPGTDDKVFQVNFRDGSTAYDATKTSTFFDASHNEADGTTALGYATGSDVAQGTGIQPLTRSVGADNDQCASGYLYLFNPSSTVFVKHWLSRMNISTYSDYTFDCYSAGYCNVTAAIDGVQFTMASGDIDAGTFKLYGIKDS